MAENVNTPVQAADANAAVVNIGAAGATATPGSDSAAKTAPATGPLQANRTEAFKQLSDRVKGLPLAQKAILGGGALFLLLVILFTSFSGMKDDYKILFSNVDERDSAAIVASLQQMNVPYKFTEGGGAITVPTKIVHETRLKLAGQGLPKSGFVGFELLENQRLGTSQFVEQVNYQRGLEGELAKSISSLALVKSARVHLAVPKQSAFVREQQRPTASVVLTLHPGRFLDKQQATAITHLVGSSVPQMGPQDVTILDSEGNLLSPSADRAEGLNQSQLKYVQELESALSKRVASILEPITGKGNVKAQVTLDMDFNELARTQEAFGRNTPPNAAAIRSQQSISAEGTTPSTGGIPGALTNQPPPNAQAPIQKGAAPKGAGTGPRVLNAPGEGASGSTSRNELTTNYEVDRTIEYLKRAKGELRRVSAAVVVNFKSQTDTKSGEVKLIPYQAAEVQQMIALARDAVGFRQDRGDSVSLANIPFTPEPVEQIPFYKDPGFLELSKEFAKFAIIIGALAIFFFVVAKPILFPPLVEVTEEEQKLEDEIDERMKAELAMMTPEIREKKRLELEFQREKKRLEEEEKRRAAEDERRMAEEERKRKAEEAQREYDELVQYAKDFVAKDPRVVANVFKGWMSTDAKAAG